MCIFRHKGVFISICVGSVYVTTVNCCKLEGVCNLKILELNV